MTEILFSFMILQECIRKEYFIHQLQNKIHQLINIMYSELNLYQSIFYSRHLFMAPKSQIKTQMNQQNCNLQTYSINDVDNFLKRVNECNYNDWVKTISTLIWNFRGYAQNINRPIKKGKKSNSEKRTFQKLISSIDFSYYIILSGQDKKYWEKILDPRNIKLHLDVAHKILQKMVSVQVSGIESKIKFKCLIIYLVTMVIHLENLVHHNELMIQKEQILDNYTLINTCLKDINSLMTELPNEQNQVYKLWLDIYQIEANFLFSETKQFKSSQQIQLNLLTDAWQRFYKAYFENDTQNLKDINFGETFQIYVPLVQKSMNHLQNVNEWTHLIKNIWMKIDFKNASKMFYKQLVSLANNHIPMEFLNQFREQIIVIVQCETEEYLVCKQNQYIQKLNSRLLQIGSGIINLKVGSNEIQNYFNQELKIIKDILLQSSVLKQKQFTLNMLRDKINKEHMIDLNCIYQINQTMTSNIKTSKKKEANFDQNTALKWFFENCPNKKETLNEISYFIKLCNVLKNIKEASREDLFACLTFYQNKLNTFMDEKLETSNINKLPFGIFDAIRILFCSIILNYLNKKICKQRRQQLSVRLCELLIVAFSKKGQAYFNPDQTQDDLNESQLQEFLCGERQIKFSLVKNIQQFCLLSQQLYENSVKLYKNNKNKDFQLIKILSSFGLLSFEHLIEQHKVYQTSLKQNYIQTYKQLIKDFIRTIQHSQQKKQIEQLPIIYYYIAQNNYLQIWKLLNQFKHVEDIKLKLDQNVKDSLMIRIYLTILIKFRKSEMQQLLRQRIVDQEITRLIIDSIFTEFKEQLSETYHQFELKQLRKKLSNSMIIYDQNEKLNRLKLSLKQNKLKGVNFHLNQYTVIPKNTKFMQIGQKLQISSVFRDNIEVCQRYQLTLTNQKEFETVIKKINLYKQFTNGLTILNIQNANLKIVMEKNSISQKFETLPNLTKSLIDDFYEIVEFTRKTLFSKLFPLMCNGNIKIHKKLSKYILDIDYTQSILYIILMQAQTQHLHIDRYQSNSKFPFYHLADNIYNPIKGMYQDKYSINFAKAYKNNQFLEFNHFIEQIKAIELEELDYTTTTVYKRILKIPYLWTPSERFLQLVDFKEKLFAFINKEQKRRKYNYQTKETLSLEERENFVSSLPQQLRHEDYKIAHGYNKASQYLFSIEGIMQKQAFFEDIGNIGTLNKQFEYGAYKWYDKKHQIKQIIDIAVQQENQRWNDNQSVYDRTYPSFQNQIRCLRNMLVHSVFLRQNVALSLQQKIEMIHENFPKLFPFIYRWKPMCGLDYFRQIKANRVNLLKSVFKRQDNYEVIKILEKNHNFNDYCFNKNYEDQKTVLLDMFNYNPNNTYECQQCNILCQSMKNTKGFWKFLNDTMRENYKDDKDNSFNILFWEHSEYGCNCAFNLKNVLRNILKRASITPEEMSFMTAEEYNAYNNQLAIKVQYSDEQLYQEFYDTDYVCKNFIFQLESQFPFLFHHLRKFRYVWDRKRLIEKPDA